MSHRDFAMKRVSLTVFIGTRGFLDCETYAVVAVTLISCNHQYVRHETQGIALVVTALQRATHSAVDSLGRSICPMCVPALVPIRAAMIAGDGDGAGLTLSTRCRTRARGHETDSTLRTQLNLPGL